MVDSEVPDWYEDVEHVLISETLGDRITADQVIEQLTGTHKKKKSLDHWWCRITLEDEKKFDCPVRSYSSDADRQTVVFTATAASAASLVAKDKRSIEIFFDDETVKSCEVAEVHSIECTGSTVTLEFS